MSDKTTKELRHRLTHIRELMAKQRSPLSSMTKEQVIEAIRKTREELWEAKFAPRT